VSTYGLDGILSWTQAHHVAGTCAQPLPVVSARLDEAAGSLLAKAMVTLADDPAADCAGHNGHAICGEGPWRRIETDLLAPGTCSMVRAGDPMPGHADAVLALEHSLSERSADGTVTVIGKDELSGVADERARPDRGTGIIRQGARAEQGATLLSADRLVTPAVLALAAASGYDEIQVIRPPVVGTLILGKSLLTSGPSRDGRVRDALAQTVPAFVGALGARGNPAVRAPDSRDLLLSEIDDANVDVLITTGSTAPDPENYVRQVLRDLDARWLIDGVAATPGAQMLLARLPDGRFLIGLPGDPRSALAGLITLAAPLITALRGAPAAVYPTAVLIDDAPAADFADDTRLAPVRLTTSDSATIAHPLVDAGPAGLQGWASADAVAIIPPGAGYRGDVVQFIRT
jgi:molybdopterin molybdotransferase